MGLCGWYERDGERVCGWVGVHGCRTSAAAPERPWPPPNRACSLLRVDADARCLRGAFSCAVVHARVSVSYLLPRPPDIRYLTFG
jgi:hypothetical protein